MSRKDTDPLYYCVVGRRALDLAKKRNGRRKIEIPETALGADSGEDGQDTIWERVPDPNTLTPEQILIHKEDRPARRKLRQEFRKLYDDVGAVLTQTERSVVELCLAQGLAQAEVAALLNISENAVKMTVRHCLVKRNQSDIPVPVARPARMEGPSSPSRTSG